MKDTNLRYAVLCLDEDLRTRVRETVYTLAPGAELVAEVPAAIGALNAEALKDLHSRAPQFAVLDLGNDPMLSLRALKHLSEMDPGRVFVLIGPELAPEMLLEAMRAGASEYLTHPVDDNDLSTSLLRAIRRVARPQVSASKRVGELFAFFGGKGGTGVTTTAANLAVQMARNAGTPVLLLDLDIELGSSALLLGMRPRYSFLDLVRNFHRMDDDLLKSYVEVHSSGVHLLSPPAKLDVTEGLTREELEPVLQYLRERYDHVIVDLPRTITPSTATVLARADQIFLVATPEIPAIRNLKRLLPVLSRMTNGRTDHLRLLINRWRDGEDPISMEDIRQVLGMEVFSTLHADFNGVAHSINVGKPIVLNGSSKYSRDIGRLSATLLGTAPAENGGSLFGSLFKSFRRGSDADPQPESKLVRDGNG